MISARHGPMPREDAEEGEVHITVEQKLCEDGR